MTRIERKRKGKRLEVEVSSTDPGAVSYQSRGKVKPEHGQPVPGDDNEQATQTPPPLSPDFVPFSFGGGKESTPKEIQATRDMALLARLLLEWKPPTKPAGKKKWRPRRAKGK